jgi:hypothetical protein
MIIKQIMSAENYWAEIKEDEKEVYYQKIVGFALIYDENMRDADLRYSVVPMTHYGDFEFIGTDAAQRKNVTIIFSTEKLSDQLF